MSQVVQTEKSLASPVMKGRPMAKAIISAWCGPHAVAADSQRGLTRNSGQGGADDAADLSERACAGGAAANSVDGEAKSRRGAGGRQRPARPRRAGAPLRD